MTRFEELSLRTEDELQELLEKTYSKMNDAYRSLTDINDPEFPRYHKELVSALSRLGSFMCGHPWDLSQSTSSWYPSFDMEYTKIEEIKDALEIMERLTDLFLEYGEQDEMEDGE